MEPSSAANAIDWLAAACAGSREALGQALQACRGYLLLIAEQELDPELRAKGGASDLVQETFLEAQRHFGQFHGTHEADLRAWLRTLLLNNLLDFARRFRDTQKRQLGREVALTGSAPSGDNLQVAAATPTPSVVAMGQEQAQAVQRMLERLPEDYRQVIVLHNQEERTFEEIATIMQRSANAVRKLWARAVERLQQEWEATNCATE